MSVTTKFNNGFKGGFFVETKYKNIMQETTKMYM